MKCFYCGGSVREGTTVFTSQTGQSLIVIKNVPCVECSQCGKVEFSDEVAARLEELVNAAKQLLQEVSIIDYQLAA